MTTALRSLPSVETETGGLHVQCLSTFGIPPKYVSWCHERMRSHGVRHVPEPFGDRLSVSLSARKLRGGGALWFGKGSSRFLSGNKPNCTPCIPCTKEEH